MHDAFALHEIICDEQGKAVDYKFIAVNPAYERMIGMPSKQLLGRRVLELFPEIGQRWIALCGEVALHGDRRNIRQYSKVIDRHLSMSLYSPAAGRFAILAMDITDEQQHAQTVERLAYYDALTGLPNRAHLSNVLRRELEENAAEFCCGALLYLDMDDLKLVNDSYGHSYGDAILITAAMHMVSLAEPGSLVARVGGDEFIIWIPGARDQQPIETFARELVDTLSREYEVRELAFHSSASIASQSIQSTAAMRKKSSKTPTRLCTKPNAAAKDAGVSLNSRCKIRPMNRCNCLMAYVMLSPMKNYWCIISRRLPFQRCVSLHLRPYCAGGAPNTAMFRRRYSSRWQKKAI